MTIPLHCIVVRNGLTDITGIHIDITDIFGCTSHNMCDEIIRRAVADEYVRRVENALVWGARVLIDDGIPSPVMKRLVDLASEHSTYVYSIRPKQGMKPIRSKASVTPPILVDGAIVVGDIHGDLSACEWAYAQSKDEKLPLIFLGDVIDYGDNSIEVVEFVYDLLSKGEALMMRGNHERKIVKWIDEPGIKLSSGNRTTTKKVNQMSQEDKDKWKKKMKAVYGLSEGIREFGDFVTTHAAIHPSYWSGNRKYEVFQTAMFGISDPKTTHSNYVPSYKWIDSIPKGRTVIVGHHHRSQTHEIVSGKLGGEVIFLDTGGGKGGPHTLAVIRNNTVVDFKTK